MIVSFTKAQYQRIKEPGRTTFNFCIGTIPEDQLNVLANHQRHLKEWFGYGYTKASRVRIPGRVVQRQVLVVPGASTEIKRIPLSTLIDAADSLETHLGLRITFLLGPQEEKIKTCGHHPVLRNLDAKSVLQAIRNSRIVIGNDSGIVKLAQLIGTPNVTVSGTTQAKDWQIGDAGRIEVIRHPCPYHGTDGPCASTRAAACIERPCLSTIAPVEIELAVRRLIAGGMRASPGGRFEPAPDIEARNHGDQGFMLSRRIGVPLYFEHGFLRVKKMLDGKAPVHHTLTGTLFSYGLLQFRRKAAE